MSTFEANPVSLQTFSISTLASYATAFEAFSLSEEEATLIAKLKEILGAGHSVRVRTDSEENTRTYELVHNGAVILGLRELQETIRSKSLDAKVVLDSHLFKVTFHIEGKEVIVIPGCPGPMGLRGESGKNGVTYEELKQKLIEEGYLPATIGLEAYGITAVNPKPQESVEKKGNTGWNRYMDIQEKLAERNPEYNVRSFVNQNKHCGVPASIEVETSFHPNQTGFSFLSKTLNKVMNDPVYSEVVQSDTNLKEETLPKVVKIFSDSGKALVIPEMELTEIISISIGHDFTLKIVSGISGRDYTLEFSDSRKARNTLNRICKKYTSSKII